MVWMRDGLRNFTNARKLPLSPWSGRFSPENACMFLLKRWNFDRSAAIKFFLGASLAGAIDVFAKHVFSRELHIQSEAKCRGSKDPNFGFGRDHHMMKENGMGCPWCFSLLKMFPVHISHSISSLIMKRYQIKLEE